MRVAILGNLVPGYVRPMAEGLERMFADINVTAEIFYDGHGQLAKVQPALRQYLGKATQGSTIKNTLKYFIREAPSFHPFLKQLRQFDVIIIVNSIAPAFLKELFRDEALRYCSPKRRSFSTTCFIYRPEVRGGSGYVRAIHPRALLSPVIGGSSDMIGIWSVRW